MFKCTLHIFEKVQLKNIINKVLKASDREKLLITRREKKDAVNGEMKLRKTANFSIETMCTR